MSTSVATIFGADFPKFAFSASRLKKIQLCASRRRIAAILQHEDDSESTSSETEFVGSTIAEVLVKAQVFHAESGAKMFHGSTKPPEPKELRPDDSSTAETNQLARQNWDAYSFDFRDLERLHVCGIYDPNPVWRLFFAKIDYRKNNQVFTKQIEGASFEDVLLQTHAFVLSTVQNDKNQ